MRVTLCIWSKQLHMIKTIIYNDIFTSLRHKKFKVRLNSSRNCSVQFVTSLHWINPLLHWITRKLHYRNQSELNNFFMYLISFKTAQELIFQMPFNFIVQFFVCSQTEVIILLRQRLNLKFFFLNWLVWTEYILFLQY